MKLKFQQKQFLTERPITLWSAVATIKKCRVMHKAYTPELCYPVWAGDVTAITVINAKIVYGYLLYMAQYNSNEDKVPI